MNSFKKGDCSKQEKFCQSGNGQYGCRRELTIVASCFWLATFLILPMLTIVQAANHEEVERFQERDLLEAKWGGRDDRVRGEGAKMPYDVLSPLLPHENRA